MKKIFLLLLSIIPFLSFSQDLKCSDFKTGQFKLYSNNSIYAVNRMSDHQIEKLIKAPKTLLRPDSKKDLYVILKWVNDCDYRAFFKETKGMDEIARKLNESNGLLTKKDSIKGRCLYYTSSSDLDSSILIKGRLCKINE